MPRFGSHPSTAALVGCLAGLTLAVSAPPASAVTIGQLAGTPTDSCEAFSQDLIQPTVTSGNPYVVPSTGGVTTWTVTSWSTNGSAAPAGQSMALKIFRKVADPATYMVVGHEGPHGLVVGPNTFAANLQVKAGDVLGANRVGGGACVFDAPGDSILLLFANLADGSSGNFEPFDDVRLNASAEIAPTNDFTVGKLKRKPNGTAILKVNVPNPGNLQVLGKGVKGSSADAVAAKRVAAGTAKLVIRAKGKKKAKLADSGKATVKPKISFTPTGGTASIESRKVKLRRK
jgi:hypothetical protein